MITQMNNDEYHKHEAISKSGLDKVSKSIHHYLMRGEFEQTPAMLIGSAIHCLALEPEKYDDLYTVMPEDIKIRRGKKWEAFRDANKSKTILTDKESNSVMSAYQAIREHPATSVLFENGVYEQSYFAKVKGVNCKAKPDFVGPGLMVDLKKTVDASPEGFQRSIGKYRYHVQAAFYMDVVNAAMREEDPEHEDIKTFYFIAVESEAPYMIGLYMIDQASIDLGRTLYEKDLKEYRKYLDNPGMFALKAYSNKVEPICAPNYCFYNAQEGGIIDG